jgi:hypothetical protein
MFLSDGGDTVRDLQMYLSPESEHWLDWFHITMRLTVMGQMIQGTGRGVGTRQRRDDVGRGLIGRAFEKLEMESLARKRVPSLPTG